jgi:hypothetical protein
MASCFQATPHSRGTAFRCRISIGIIAIFIGIIAIFIGIGSCGKCCKRFRLRICLEPGFCIEYVSKVRGHLAAAERAEEEIWREA